MNDRCPAVTGNPWRPLPWLAALWLAATGCTEHATPGLQGYLEAEFVQIGAPLAGMLTQLAVARGDDVTPGQPLFQLEHAAETATLAEADQRLAQARARLDNLRTGRRPSELESLEAQLRRAVAERDLAESDLTRRTQLARDQVISAAELDQARSRHDANSATVRVLEAELVTARLGARADEIRAAEADVEASARAQEHARWAVEQKRQVAPTAGRIHDTLFRAGEFVPAGQPIISLLPPANLKARFFVPEPEIAKVHPGQAVRLSLNGRATPVAATVSFVAPQAEFTPPVIYSKENRAKLVFMVEARLAPADAAQLRPGQPVDVTLQP